MLACRPSPPVPSLAARAAAMAGELAARWESMAPELPALGPRTGAWRHLHNRRAAQRLIDALAEEVPRVAEEPARRLVWREGVRERLQEFGARRLGWPAGYRRLLLADGFFGVSRNFARAARAFDPTLALDDLWQALRN